MDNMADASTRLSNAKSTPDTGDLPRLLDELDAKIGRLDGLITRVGSVAADFFGEDDAGPDNPVAPVPPGIISRARGQLDALENALQRLEKRATELESLV